MRNDFAILVAMKFCRVPLLAFSAAGLLAGCTGLFGVDAEPGQPVAPVGAPPLVSDRFLLNSADQRVVGSVQTLLTRDQDTFVDIARTYNLGFDELVQANPGVDPWLPGAATRIVLPTRFVLPDVPQAGIVINLAAKRLYYFPPLDEDGARAVVTFPIGIGREGTATPLGTTTVTQKGADPVWFPPASIRREYAAAGNPLPARVLPGPENPLGKFVLVLGMPSYLIHGTNRPAGVGMRVSHGCVRLFPENIEFLYGVAPVGVGVTIVDEPYLFAWDAGELLFEAHPPLEDDSRDWPALLPERLADAVSDLDQSVPLPDAARVAAISAAALGLPFSVLTGSTAPEQVLADATLVNNLVVLPAESALLSAVDADE